MNIKHFFSLPLAILFAGCPILLCAATNDVLSIYFPSNVTVGMAESQVQSNRPNAITITTSFLGSEGIDRIVEKTELLGVRAMWEYRFTNTTLRAITSSFSSGVDTNALLGQILNGGFTNQCNDTFLRLDGALGLSEIQVDVWGATGSVQLCSTAASNETSLVLFDSEHFSVSDFFMSTSFSITVRTSVSNFLNGVNTNSP